MEYAKTLIVDDEDDVRKSLHDELVMDGWDVVEARDGLAALQHLEKQDFDVVVSDVRMPNLDGWGLLRQVREKDLETIFVIMSAYADIPPWEPYALGADAIFGKPFRISDLEELIKRMRLPMLERWGDAERQKAAWEITDHMEVDVTRYPENFSLGRGGMFLDRKMPNIRKGGIMSFRVTTPEFVLEGIGKVRWTRGTNKEGLAPGLGVEFLYLNDSHRGRVVQAIAKSKERAFIPRGSLAK
jgi:CheY-like chemotaxis protein